MTWISSLDKTKTSRDPTWLLQLYLEASRSAAVLAT